MRPHLPRARARERAGAGDLVELVALTPDGLGVLRDGTLIRVFEVSALNPLILDAESVEHQSRRLGGVLARVPAGQGVQFYVQSRPIALDELSEQLREHVKAAALAAANTGSHDRARALMQLAYCELHSLLTHAPRLAATSTSYYVIVPWRPVTPFTARLKRSRQDRGGVRSVEPAAHTAAAEAHERYAHQLTSALAAAGVRPRPLDGPELCELLWARFCPEDADAGAPGPALAEPAPWGALEDPTSEAEAAELAAYLAAVIAGRPISGRSHVRVGSSVEAVLALSSVPEQTWLGWVMHLMGSPLPWSLSVHVTATDRSRERTRQRRRYKRLYGMNRGSEQRGRPVDPEARQREEEASELNETLAASAGAGIYELAVYLSVRDPGGSEKVAREHATEVAKELLASTDAKADMQGLAQRRLWQASLPFAHDRARRRRRYLTANAADTIPLVGTGCGSPSSPTCVGLGYAHPGRTLEGLDPFDGVHPNHLMLIAGRSGAGKTMTTNLLLARCLARGAVGTIIDRAGHYAFLASLVPGCAQVELGAGAHTINPWDGEPDAEKFDYLLRVHELLVGHHDKRVDEHGLGVLERTALLTGIRRVYERCERFGELPRETVLREELARMHLEAKEDGDSDLASIARLLAEALGPYAGAGPYAYLADHPTTVPTDPALLVYDTQRIGDDQSPAMLFIVCEQAVRRAQARRAGYLAGGDDGSPWAGKSMLVVDEAWKLLQRKATGRWVNELARRSRHYALCMIAISQELGDFTGEEGAALLSQSSIRLLLSQRADQLPILREALALTGEELDAIAQLETSKREHATCFIQNGARGSGVLTLTVSDLEYWLATNEPIADEPVRRAALRDAGGDPWAALSLLADPAWHQARDHPAGEERAA